MVPFAALRVTKSWERKSVAECEYTCHRTWSARSPLRPGTRTYLAFRTAARRMAAEAQSRKEVLVKHGLAESVLVNLTQTLDQFDAAVESGVTGRQTHVGASAELQAVADEIFQIVQVMDGLNRYRFMNDPDCSPHRRPRRSRAVRSGRPHDAQPRGPCPGMVPFAPLRVTTTAHVT
jgi:hypothetical protein